MDNKATMDYIVTKNSSIMNSKTSKLLNCNFFFISNSFVTVAPLQVQNPINRQLAIYLYTTVRYIVKMDNKN